MQEPIPGPAASPRKGLPQGQAEAAAFTAGRVLRNDEERPPVRRNDDALGRALGEARGVGPGPFEVQPWVNEAIWPCRPKKGKLPRSRSRSHGGCFGQPADQSDSRASARPTGRKNDYRRPNSTLVVHRLTRRPIAVEFRKPLRLESQVHGTMLPLQLMALASEGPRLYGADDHDTGDRS